MCDSNIGTDHGQSLTAGIREVSSDDTWTQLNVLLDTFKTSENFIKVNHFFCVLHVLVGLVDQTKVAFKA